MERATSPREVGRPGKESRSARKRRVIIKAATDAFLRNGYLGTSMDEIAALAGVSKPTVYKQFVDKERLFTEVVLSIIGRVGDPFFASIDSLDEAEDPITDLKQLARRLIGIVREPLMLQLRRLCIGEASRFPKLGRTFYEQGHGRSVGLLASKFQRLAQRGFLRLDDAGLAAQHFTWLVLSIPLNRAMFYAHVDFSAVELKRYADEAVRVFLSAYGRH